MAEYDDRLSLAAYPFPEINRGDMVFATIETDPILLEEAKKRGFYMKDTPANPYVQRTVQQRRTIDL